MELINILTHYFNILIEWLDKFTILIGIGTFIFTLWNWLSNRKLNRKLKENISICLFYVGNGQSKTLPHTIKRRHLTRSEIQGILGNFYEGNDRYDIPFLGKKAYSEAIEKAQNGDSNIITIPIENLDTFNQFKILEEI